MNVGFQERKDDVFERLIGQDSLVISRLYQPLPLEQRQMRLQPLAQLDILVGV